MSNIDKLSIQTLRQLAIEAIDNANSGHPGIALGAAPTIHTLYTKFLNIYPHEDKWLNRDRFVLSAGHGSSLLYAVLHLSGYLSIEDLKNFRNLNSITPGHPESHITPGVDATSGPLGQGIGEAVGIAIAEAHLHGKFPNIIDHYTYCLCGDGDLQEGVAQEALSLAGNLSLNKLILLYDSNDIQLDSKVQDTNTENTRDKILAMNWNYILVSDGENIEELEKAIVNAQNSDKPTLIEIKTIIGIGASNAGTPSVHGAPLKHDEVVAMRKALGGEPFTVSDEVYKYYEEKLINKGKEKYLAWKQNLNDEFLSLLEPIKVDLDKMPTFPDDYKAATRVSSGKVLDSLSKEFPQLIGGSADLSSSTKVAGADGDFTQTNRLGRNIKFGVREHAMAAITNGIALHGVLRPFCSGFFVFSDYMKPAIRLSALMELPVIYIFTHDSIAVGEDGPTHQPIEQLTMLRSIPNLNVIRPADANEVKVAYKLALESKKTPTVIVLTRQDVGNVVKGEVELEKGGYIAKDEENFEGILIASGSELELALNAQKLLKEKGVNVRVVSMPSTNLFDKQDESYKEKVLPPHITKRLAIELSEGAHLYKYVGLFGDVYGMCEFGRSGKGSVVINHFGFTPEKIVERYLKLPNIDIIRYINND
ncbi:MAG TPA: transketolase [Acholeplasmataceae bacterium]|jgi:transketolase|nr:transketolase [Acholeplasmataceae bacterium]